MLQPLYDKKTNFRKSAETTMDVTIYHNPVCGTSRKVLGMIREAGIEPHVIEYMKTPLPRDMLVELLRQMDISPRILLRAKEARYAELWLDDPALSDEALIDAMISNPVLMNRPVVITPKGVRLCRPAETVQELL
ncbi:arsenate reductase ArsC, putative [Brucella vulpis]|nr:arsenate reductase ArsC, putative [Brucella vulpis]CUW50600.1 arsenate reductase ArsC, putative [Brucella vulpis]